MNLLDFKKTDFFVWVLAALLGLASMALPGFLDLQTPLTIAHMNLFLSGVVVGYFKPHRPWRWGIATVLLFPVTEFVGLTTAPLPSGPASHLDSLLYLLVKLPIYALQALVALLGAYTASIARLGLPSSCFSTACARSVLHWLLGFALGLVVGSVPLLVAPRHLIFLLWMTGLFLSATVLGVTESSRVWRWGIAVSIGLPTSVILQIIFDIVSGRAPHNVFPIEILVALIIALPSAFLGAYFGVLMKRIFTKRKKRTP
jgi:hypothetical protein